MQKRSQYCREYRTNDDGALEAILPRFTAFLPHSCFMVKLLLKLRPYWDAFTRNLTTMDFLEEAWIVDSVEATMDNYLSWSLAHADRRPGHLDPHLTPSIFLLISLLVSTSFVAILLVHFGTTPVTIKRKNISYNYLFFSWIFESLFARII